jgi:hypothetical protein
MSDLHGDVQRVQKVSPKDERIERSPHGVDPSTGHHQRVSLFHDYPKKIYLSRTCYTYLLHRIGWQSIAKKVVGPIRILLIGDEFQEVFFGRLNNVEHLLTLRDQKGFKSVKKTLTFKTWYHTDDPPKSMWKSVYESRMPIRQNSATSGFDPRCSYWTSPASGDGTNALSEGHKRCTQLSSRTMSGGCTT